MGSIPIPGANFFIMNEFTEKHKETIDFFKSIQNDMLELLIKKQIDYGINNITLGKDPSIEENQKLILTGLWFRMNDKIQRVINIVGKSPQNESLEDTYIDLANYALISILILKNKWFK